MRRAEVKAEVAAVAAQAGVKAAAERHAVEVEAVAVAVAEREGRRYGAAAAVLHASHAAEAEAARGEVMAAAERHAVEMEALKVSHEVTRGHTSGCWWRRPAGRRHCRRRPSWLGP